MTFLSIGLMIGGLGMIWLSKRTTDQQIRQIGIGLLVGGAILMGLLWLDVPIFPS